MIWVCDNCQSEMEVWEEGYNKKRVSCPKCGTEWFVDENNEIIDENEVESDEKISVYEAAQIWVSNGKDEDYMFVYTEQELEDVLY